ncbi:MAG: L-seryl-tRNA(Sec) selenium transferase [Candidatus Methanoperedenaceae archaeon GB37]|nr:MAG: L-seryl-tRNA(Sec) selenium transferase [Candidatus Methanoperedenaceae archaeon GB37]
MLLRQIPSVDQVLGQESLRSILNHYPRQMVVDAVRKVLDRQRKQVLRGELVTISHQEILSQITVEVKKKGENQLKPVINATGVVVHTNLGRSLLAQKAIEHLVEVAQHYNNLEYDLEQGKRGSRYSHVETLLCELTGAEASIGSK